MASPDKLAHVVQGETKTEENSKSQFHLLKEATTMNTSKTPRYIKAGSQRRLDSSLVSPKLRRYGENGEKIGFFIRNLSSRGNQEKSPASLAKSRSPEQRAVVGKAAQKLKDFVSYRQKPKKVLKSSKPRRNYLYRSKEVAKANHSSKNETLRTSTTSFDSKHVKPKSSQFLMD
jgi:hypothetical protein